MQLILGRHGKAESNEASDERIVAGPSHLVTEGYVQITATAYELLDVLTADTIFCSPRARCQESAQVIANVVGGMVVMNDKRLNEISLGDWEGRPVSEVIGLQHKVAAKMVHTFRPPNGENWEDVAERMTSWVFEQYVEGCEQLIGLSHDHPIRMCMGRLLGIPLPKWEMLEVANGAFYTLSTDDGTRWQIDSYFDPATVS